MTDRQPDNTLSENKVAAVPSEVELLYSLAQDKHLLTPIVLIGASALIPVPFLDDIAKAYLEKYLFNTIAKREGHELSKQEAEELTREPSGGCCAWGCLGSAILYPLKRILRKLFFFLEIKRAVDQCTTALAQAWLFQLTVKRELWRPGQDIVKAQAVRRAIKEACHSQGVKPLETAVSSVFRGAKSSLYEVAAKFTQKTGSGEKDMARAVDALEQEEQEKLASLTQKLSASLNQVSDSHIERLAQAYQSVLKHEIANPPEQVA